MSHESGWVVRATRPALCRTVSVTPMSPFAPIVGEAPWTTCGRSPATAAEIVIKLSEGTMLRGTTDQQGTATISALALKPKASLAPTAEVTVGGEPSGTLDLGTTPVFAAWKAAFAQDDAEYQAQLVQARARRQQRTLAEWKASAEEKVRALPGAYQQLQPLAPPWNEPKLGKLKAAMAACDAATLTDDEFATLDPASQAKATSIMINIRKKYDALKPGLAKAMDDKMRAMQESAARWNASPEGRQARCESRCEEGGRKRREACSNSDCRTAAEGDEAMCKAGCLK